MGLGEPCCTSRSGETKPLLLHGATLLCCVQLAVLVDVSAFQLAAAVKVSGVTSWLRVGSVHKARAGSVCLAGCVSPETHTC